MKRASLAVTLYRRLSADELVVMGRNLRTDPANANPAYATGKSPWLFKPSIQARLNAIDRAISWHDEDNRRAIDTDDVT